MKKTIYIFILALVGCSASGPRYLELPVASDATESEIVIYRQKKLSGSGGCYRINVDGDQIGILQNGGFLRIFVEPSVHSVSVVLSEKLDVNITTKEGKTTFLEYGFSLNGMDITTIGNLAYAEGAWNTFLIERPKEQAMKILSNLRESQVQHTCMSK